MLIGVSSISGAPGVSSWSLLVSAAWPGSDPRNRVLVEADTSGGVLAVRYGMSPAPGIVELISNVRQGIPLRETLPASAHRLGEKLWAVPAPSSADAAWPILIRMGELGPVLSAGDDLWFIDCGRWWPSSPCIGVTSAADLNLILVDAEDSSLLSVRSRVDYFRQFGPVGVVVVGSTQRSLEELELNFGADLVWNMPHIKQLDILAGQAATSGKARRSNAWRYALDLSHDLRDLLAAPAAAPAENLAVQPEAQAGALRQPAPAAIPVVERAVPSVQVPVPAQPPALVGFPVAEQVPALAQIPLQEQPATPAAAWHPSADHHMPSPNQFPVRLPAGQQLPSPPSIEPEPYPAEEPVVSVGAPLDSGVTEIIAPPWAVAPPTAQVDVSSGPDYRGARPPSAIPPKPPQNPAGPLARSDTPQVQTPPLQPSPVAASEALGQPESPGDASVQTWPVTDAAQQRRSILWSAERPTIGDSHDSPDAGAVDPAAVSETATPNKGREAPEIVTETHRRIDLTVTQSTMAESEKTGNSTTDSARQDSGS